MAESFMLDVEMMIMVESKRLCMMSVAITRLKKLWEDEKEAEQLQKICGVDILSKAFSLIVLV